MSRGSRTLLDYTHVWLLPQYSSATWWELDDESIAQLPIRQRCDNMEIYSTLQDMNILFVGSLKYNIVPLSSRDVDGSYKLVCVYKVLIDITELSLSVCLPASLSLSLSALCVHHTWLTFGFCCWGHCNTV